MLTKLWSGSFGAARGFAETDGHADDFTGSPDWMVVVDDIVVGNHLRIIWQFVDAIDHSVNKIAAVFKNLHPFITRLRGKLGVENTNDFFAALGPVSDRAET